MREKLSQAGELVKRMDAAMRKAGFKQSEYDPEILFLRNPKETMMGIFGLDGEDVYRKGNRDFPRVIKIEDFTAMNAVRLTVGHLFGRNVIEILYDSKDGRLLSIHKTGDLYPAHVSGSRWYTESDYENLLDDFPELTSEDGGLTDDQMEALGREEAKLVSYYFFPNDDTDYGEHLEGSARVVYFWDLAKNKWTYVAHSERDFGTKADVEDNFYVGAGRVDIEPFGSFSLPKEIEMTELLKNLMFPLIVREEITPGINHDFLGVERV